jgi:hypothetical protein
MGEEPKGCEARDPKYVLWGIPAKGDHRGPIFEEVDQVMQIAIATSPIPSEPPIPPEPIPPPEPLVPPTEPPIPPPWPPQPPPEPEPPVLEAPPVARRSGTSILLCRGVAVECFTIDLCACRTTGSPHRHHFPLDGDRRQYLRSAYVPHVRHRPLLSSAGRVHPTSRRRWEALLAAVATV